jgi:CHAD domain-containing protein/transposase-like protein
MLQPDQREHLRELTTHATSASERRRAQLLLLYDHGLTTSEIAKEVDLSPSRVRYWRRAFEAKGLDIFRSLSELIHAPEGSIPASEQEARPVSELAPLTPEGLREHYHRDPHHAAHVRDLARWLFDETQHLHNLPAQHRTLIATAAFLHDMALDEGARVDPHAGGERILAHPLAGLSADEQAALAALVRHQCPKKKVTQDVIPESHLLDRRQFLILTALLRIAIALDTSQSQTTRTERLAETPQALYLVVKGEHAVQDAAAAQRQSKQWRKSFRYDLRVITEQQAEEISLTSEIIPFPEPIEDPGVLPEDSLTEAGRKVLRYHFAEMLRHEVGTKLGQDIEELHDMRVAVRRMRVAFEIFRQAFDPKIMKHHLKGLKAIGRTLGRVRDLDVFMEKADRYLDTLAQDKRSGLAPLLKDWQDQRSSAREQMLTFLESDIYRSFLREFNVFVGTSGAGMREGMEDYHAPHFVCHAAPVMIYSRLGTVRAYNQILGTATIEQLHELRIEFKKLRYTVEFFREVLGPESKTIIEEIKGVQDHLGDLNDAEVACKILREFLEGWEAHQQTLPLSERENPEPIVAYLAARHAERHHLMVTFGETWAHFDRPEFRESIAQAVAVL